MSPKPFKRAATAQRKPTRGAGPTTAQILKAARTVLIKHGHSGFTIRRVAECAGISPGNLTYHFPTKRALLQALIAQLVDDYSNQFRALLENAEIPAGQELRQLVPWLLDDAVTEEGMRTFRELWTMSLHDPVIRRATDNLYDTLMGYVTELLQRSHPKADIKSIREVVQYLALVSEGSIVLYGTRKKRAVSLDRIIEITISLLEDMAPELQTSVSGRGGRK